MGLLSEVENGLGGGEVPPEYALILVHPALEELVSSHSPVPRVDPSASETKPVHLDFKNRVGGEAKIWV